MGNISLEVYLFFKGNCREAMEFYKEVFGGNLEMSTIGEAPPMEGMEEFNKDWIMHASLSGGDVKLMASDSPKASDHTAKAELSIVGTDETRMREIFDKLSEGGKVKMALEKQYWGDLFGMLEDKFGVDWNMNIGAMEISS